MILSKIKERCQHYINLCLYPSIVRDLSLALTLSLYFTLNLEPAYLPKKRILYPAAEKYEKMKAQIGSHIQRKNPFLSSQERHRLVEIILKKANQMHLPRSMKIEGSPVQAVYFLTALIQIESNFNARARSPVGARGYMQIMPRTSRWMNQVQKTNITVDQLYDAEINITRGIDYLNYLIRKLKDIRIVCLAYNAGEGNVKNGVWVESYWRNISRVYKKLKKEKIPMLTHNSSRLE